MRSADSKTLTDPRREELLEVIIEKDENVHYACTVMSPHDISRGMLRKTPYNLYATAPLPTVPLLTCKQTDDVWCFLTATPNRTTSPFN